MILIALNTTIAASLRLMPHKLSNDRRTLLASESSGRSSP